MKTQLQKCLDALVDLCECSKGICLPAEIDSTIEQLRETLAKTDAPTSWVEMVAVNLVREGVNKHKARELALHFYEKAQDFYEWQKNPYTIVLQKSIAEDYVPRAGQPKPKIVCYIDSADIEYMKLPGCRIVRVSNVSWDVYQVPLYRWG